MEFFDWFSVGREIGNLFLQLRLIREGESLSAEALKALWVSLDLTNMYICLAAAAGIYLLLLIFGGLGLRTMAKQAGVKVSAAVFLPFANTYYAGKLAGEANFFGQKMKRAGLYAMLAEIVYVCLGIFLIVTEFLLTKPDYFIVNASGTEETVLELALSASKVPENLQWLCFVQEYFGIVSYLVWFIVVIFFSVLFTALFRKYYARNPFLMTLLCSVFPFRGFTLFAVRKNRPLDYNEYMRRRYAERYGYGRQDAPYGAEPPRAEPFPDFEDKPRDPPGPDNPFSDFE